MAAPSAAERSDTLIIGAGPAGLAVAACLSRRGLPFTLVDREATVGSAWRRHYERLHLHTARQHSGLPHLPMPAAYPTWPSREQVVAYLDQYAAHFDLRPRLGVTVTRAAHEDGAWHVATTPGPGFVARHLVVASGYNADPTAPRFPGLETFPGAVMHSSRYRSGAQFAGQDVLVVGAGNSGAEIAVDLWEHGARPSLVIRSPIHVVPREVFGRPAQTTTILLSRLPPRLADRLTVPIARRLIGDLSPWGIHRPAVGPLEQIVRAGRVPLIDVGTVPLIKQGAIRVRPGVTGVAGDEVTFADGRAARFAAIVLATGYRAALDRFLAGAEAVTDARGNPTAHGREAIIPGLWFCGFRNPTTGALREIGLEAPRIAADIARVSRA